MTGGSQEPGAIAASSSDRDWVDQVIASNKVELHDLILLASRRSKVLTTDEQRRQHAHRRYPDLLRAFKENDPDGHVALFQDLRAGVRLRGSDLQLHASLPGDTVHFDCGLGRRLLFRIDALNEDARRWVADRPERQSIGERCYGLSAHVLEAVEAENKRVGQNGARPAPSSEFADEIAFLEREVDGIELDLRTAMQRSAMVMYAKGMLLGGALLVVLLAAAAIVFDRQHLPAYAGIGALGGGMGALVSVLQRMSSGKLHLEPKAAGRMLMTFGAVRPLLGAVFGMLVFAAMEGGLIPSVEIPDGSGHAAAFFGTLGFVAGFNERFAPDMLARVQSVYQGDEPQPEI